MKLPFLSFTAHSRRNLTHAQRCTVPEAAYFYYTIKGGVSTRFILQESYFFHTFRNMFPGVKPKAFFYFTYILHCAFSGRRISPLTRPAPPWPPAPCPPRRGTPRPGYKPPHGRLQIGSRTHSWCSLLFLQPASGPLLFCSSRGVYQMRGTIRGTFRSGHEKTSASVETLCRGFQIIRRACDRSARFARCRGRAERLHAAGPFREPFSAGTHGWQQHQ